MQWHLHEKLEQTYHSDSWQLTHCSHFWCTPVSGLRTCSITRDTGIGLDCACQCQQMMLCLETMVIQVYDNTACAKGARQPEA